MEFLGVSYQRNSMWNFRGKRSLVEFAKWNFQRWPRKNNVEFLGVLVFDLGIFKESNTVLWNCQGWSFVLSGISKGKVKMKYFRGVPRSMSSTTLPICFFFFWNSPIFCILHNKVALLTRRCFERGTRNCHHRIFKKVLTI